MAQVHRLELTDTRPLRALVTEKVKSGEWNINDGFVAYRGKTKVFNEILSVRFHITNRVRESHDEQHMHYERMYDIPESTILRGETPKQVFEPVIYPTPKQHSGHFKKKG